ncbi:MAG: secretion protein HlyD [Methylibium sp. NZG]|nr:MAG: secretion protein HlyD [Methylibium sp. NZG]
MKPWLKWLIPVVAVAVLGAFIARALQARKAEQTPLAAQKAVVALDLAPSDMVTARQIELTRTLDVSGGLKAVNSATLRAKVAGELKSLTVREGDTVKRGQVLGQIDTTELDWRLRQAEQTASSTRAQADIAKRALENNRALVAQGFISPTGLETSVSNDAAAQANLQAALAAVELARKARGDSTLVSPLAGLVSQRLVQVGERVSVDARLIEVVDLSKLELEAAIAPEDVVALEVGRPATLRVDGLPQPVSAQVARINPSAQVGSRSVLVYLAVEPNAALRQGLFAKGRIATSAKQVLAVPLTAVRTDQALPYVLQVLDDKAQLRSVQLGQRGDVGGQPWVEITAGLSDGARVLAGSAGLVRDGTPVRVLAAPVAASIAPATVTTSTTSTTPAPPATTAKSPAAALASASSAAR